MPTSSPLHGTRLDGPLALGAEPSNRALRWASVAYPAIAVCVLALFYWTGSRRTVEEPRLGQHESIVEDAESADANNARPSDARSGSLVTAAKPPRSTPDLDKRYSGVDRYTSSIGPTIANPYGTLPFEAPAGNAAHAKESTPGPSITPTGPVAAYFDERRGFPAEDRPAARHGTDPAKATIANAFGLMERGALEAAEAEIRTTLARMTARAEDRTAALRAGLLALSEADDFVYISEDDLETDTQHIAEEHATPIVRETLADRAIARDAAVRAYLSFAREQMIAGVGGAPQAAAAVYALGRVYRIRAEQCPGDLLSPAKAVALHQAAVRLDPHHHKALNDLGVLLARGGCWDEAQGYFERSVAAACHSEGWHNLAIAYAKQNRPELAAEAAQRAELVPSETAQSGPAREPGRRLVGAAPGTGLAPH